jgi:hypothetical protein
MQMRPKIVSDFAVHQEQASGLASFFYRTNARSLADAMKAVWMGENPLLSAESQAPPPQDPVRRFADDFVNLSLRVVDEHRHS